MAIYEKILSPTISDTLGKGMLTSDEDGKIVEINDVFLQMFGYTRKELIGKDTIMFVPPNKQEKHRVGLILLKSTGLSPIIGKFIEIKAVVKGGKLIDVELYIVPVVENNRRYYVAVARDITLRKERERQIEIFNQALDIRVKALEAFQYSISHDLNAPLRALEGFSEILVQDYNNKLDDTGKMYIERIRLSVNRIRQLMDDLIRLSKVTQPNLELKFVEINVSKMGQKIASDLQLLNQGRSVPKIIIQPDMYITADEEFMHIVIENLFSNAWKFTSKTADAKIEFGSEVVDGKTVYFVLDNGVGFDMSKYNKLFLPFSRLHKKEEFPGNGIGLSVVRQIITLHGGEIWASSKLNAGAGFYFTIGTNKDGTT